jgi:hypothetical protein
MSNERLHKIGHLLLGAGSDLGTITLNVPDAKLLELTDLSADQKFKGKDKKYVWNETTKEYELRDIEVEVIGVVPEIHVGTKKILCYIVCVGLARKMLKKLLGGQSIDGCRQPDVPAPLPVEEEVPV